MPTLSLFYNVVCLFFLVSLSAAADDGHFIMKGTIIKKGCTVENVSKTQTVILGDISTKHFRNTRGIRTNPMPFTVSLINCSSPSVSLVFSGDEYLNSGLLSLNGSNEAQGIAVELSDYNKSFIPLNQKIASQMPDMNGNVKFNFYANYISVSQNIAAGSASADAVFSLTYE